MADPLMGPRCTRRKQANPRRKNVELEDMPEEVDLDHLGPGDSIAKDSPVPEATTTTTTMTSTTTSSADCSDERDTGTSKRSLCTNSIDNGASKNDFHVGLETGSAHKSVRRTFMDSNPSPPKSPSGAHLVPNLHAVTGVGNDAKSHPDDDSKSEEEKIQEYLQRSDTAVIYPEPVDGDPNATEQASPSPPKTTSVQPIDHSGSLDKRSSISKEDFYLKCPHCDKVYPSLETFRLHLVSQHGAADSSPVLNSVDNTSSGIGGFACDKCSATFAHKSQLEKHEGLHSPTAQVVACKVCNKTFANVYRLQRHMISHDESAVLRKFKCPECEKAFKFKHHLKEHIRIHSGEKPFACPNCGKRFSHSGSYSSHMTSKKCLVMNLKVRRTIDKPNVRGNGVASAGTNGGGGGRRGSSQGAFTPILPKYGENGLELSPGYGPPPGLSVADHYATAGIDFVPPSMQAFLPPPYGLHPLLTANHHHHFTNSGLPMYAGLAGPPPPSLASLAHMIRPSAIAVKANEDGRDSSLIQQRDATIPSLAAISPHSEVDDAGKAFRAQSPEESSSSSDLKAVKQILATVNATVSKQQQEMTKLRNGISVYNQSIDGDRSTPSPTTSRTESPVTNNTTVSLPHSPNTNMATDSNSNIKRNGYRGDDSHCRHCGDGFESKIDLHQHERYLCKMNRDIFPASNKIEVGNNNELTTTLGEKSNHAMSNGCSDMDDDPPMSDMEDGCRDMGEDGLDGDGRKVRMRSLFSEEQQSVLRSYYEVNARPGKEELQKIAAEIKFPPRVVQVWFQNMRARDKKRGRSLMSGKDVSAISSWYSDSSPPPSQQHISSQHAKTPFSAISPTSSYGATSLNGSLLASRIPHPPIFYPTPSPSPFSLPTAPLRINGQSSSPPSFAAPPFPLDHEQPLDLSVKGSNKSHNNNNSCHSPAASDQSISDGEVLNLSQKSSRTSTPSKESNNNVNYAAVTTSGALGGLGSHLNYQDHNALLKANEPSAIFKYMMTTPKMELDDLSAGEETPDLIVMRRNFSGSPTTCDTPRLHRILASSPHMDVSSFNGTVDSSGRVYSTDGSHSPCPSDHDDHLEIDEGSDIHRRCWAKADHGDESQLDLDDSSMGEDDRPLKRRKSWKQHKLDSEDGMYACDQCDKVFSKQSSLARHKYEHSGQRPHKCDVCSKAFKHKHHLTEHKRLHSGEKPFQCKKCLKRFSHSGSYSQHMNHRYSYCKPYRE